MSRAGRERISRAVELAQLPESVEDGLLQLQLRTMACAAWREMAAAYDGMLAIFESAASPNTQLCDRLRRDRGEVERAAPAVERLQHSYADAYEQSRRALRVTRNHTSLTERGARVSATVRHAEAVRALQRVLAQRLAGFEFGDERAIASLVELLFPYLLAEQGAVAVAVAVAGPATVATAQRTGELQSSRRRRPALLQETPDLLELLEEELGVRVQCGTSGIEVTDLGVRAIGPAP
jgi:hypothetical protein